MLRSLLIKQPFEQQAPEVQALMQACVKQLLRQARSWGLQPALLDLLSHMPLLHAADYEYALELAHTAGGLAHSW
jgi:hypothetical protein